MLENIALAFQSLWSHKLRSVLAMLGIIIGIASVISIISNIQGTNEQIKENLIGSGTNAVTIKLYEDGYEHYSYAFDTSSPEGILPISDDLMEEILAIPHVEDAARYCMVSFEENIVCGSSTGYGNVYGVDDNYFSVAGYTLSFGRLFDETDGADHHKVVIIDDVTMQSLFANRYPIGETMEIEGEAFTVIGVVSKNSTSDAMVEDISDYYTYVSNGSGGEIFLPLENWPMVYRFDEPLNAVIRASSTDTMTSVGQKAETLLTENLIVGEDSSYTYECDNLMEQAKQLQSLSSSTNSQLVGVAIISLLVGGIGVMNIMLVSVTERTKEIGLKKALGARPRVILRQFLTEAVVLTAVGGVIGVGAGIALSKIMSFVSGTPSAINVPASIGAFAVSMIIGIIAGMAPAVKASHMDPIEALRTE